jgi:hypothetical protein
MTDYIDPLGGGNKDTDRFRTTFYKSEEMIQAFKEVGIEYHNRMWDDDYERFQQKTKRTGEKDRIKYISNMKRLIIPVIGGREKEQTYIVHDMYERAKDGLGNELTAYRSNLGCYHKPRVRREIRLNMETGDKEPVIVGVDSLDTCYSIPFTKESIASLEKYVVENTAFSIQKGDGQTFTVDRFEDWKNGSTEELLRFGHKASDYEKQVLADEKQGKYQHYTPPVNPGLQYR